MAAQLSPIERTYLTSTAAQLADRFRREALQSPAEFPVSELRDLAEAGLLGVTLPQALGGMGVGLDPGSKIGLLQILKEMGRGSLPLGRVYEGHVNALLLIQRYGTNWQLERAAGEVLRLGSVFGVWNTGPPATAQLQRLANGNFQLSGAKTFATGASRIQNAIVTAAFPEGGWQMCLVPLFKEDLVIHTSGWEPLGMEASESFTVEFSDIELTPEALIGQPDDYYAEPFFTSGAFRYTAVQLGGAQALFDACCAFVRTMQRADEPMQLQRIAQMAVAMESGAQWLEKAGAWTEEADENPALLIARTHMMRIAIEEICTRVIQLTEVSVGARGLAEAEPFARTLRDLQMYLRQAGFDQAFQSVGRQAMQENRSRVHNPSA